MKGFKLKYWGIPLLLFVVFAIVFRVGAFSGNKQPTSEKDNRIPVKAVEVVQKQTVSKLLFNATVEGSTSAAISAKLAGRIKEIVVQEGQKVQAGDPLLRLEEAELANSVQNSQAALVKAQVNYDLALADYHRYQQLHTQDAISEQQMQVAEAKLKTAQADVDSAAANEKNAQQQYSYSVITAPVDGIVANKTATLGQVVSPGSPLMTVQDLHQVYAVINIEQKDMGRIQPGQTAQMLVDAYPDKPFTGTVELMNPEAGAGNRMFRAKIKVNNELGLLKAGMFAKVELTAGAPAPLIAVPQAAILQKQGLYYVFSIEKDVVARRQVGIGEISNANIEIKNGLTPGEKVAITSVNQLKDGQAVRIVE